MPPELATVPHLHTWPYSANVHAISLRLNNFSPSTSSLPCSFSCLGCVFVCISHLRENCYVSLRSHPHLFRHFTNNHLCYACEVWGKLFSVLVLCFEHNPVDSAWIHSIIGKRKSLNGPAVSNIYWLCVACRISRSQQLTNTTGANIIKLTVAVAVSVICNIALIWVCVCCIYLLTLQSCRLLFKVTNLTLKLTEFSIIGPTGCTVYFQFITINSLCMFRALICSSSGGTVYTAIGIFCAEISRNI
jgi:hypothetical protein